MIKEKYRALKVIAEGSSIALTIDLALFNFFFFFAGHCELVKVFNLQNEALHKQYCFLNSKLR